MTFQDDADGDVADHRLMNRLKPVPQRVLDVGEGTGCVGRKAEEDVDVTVFEVGAFGVGAGEGDGLEIFVITPAAK